MQRESTLLIVDDQLSTREVLRGLLTGQGYELAFASSGQEALAKASELRPDLILLDVMMPGMDDFEVCKRLRADSHLAEAPINIVTAHLDTDHIEAGSLLGPLLHSLRRKVGAAVGETGFIENVRGVGYRLLEPDG